MMKEEEQAKINYYKGIRKKLIAKIDEIRTCGYVLYYPALVEYISNNYNISVDEKTIKKLFTESENSAIYPHYLIPICNILGLDIYDTLQYENSKELNISQNTALRQIIRLAKDKKEMTAFFENFVSDDVTFLTDSLYEGEYNCYYFALNCIYNSIAGGKCQPQVNRIRTGKLTIETVNGETIATFVETNAASGNSFKFVGRVLKLQSVNKIYIFLSEKSGKGFMWLLFNNVVLKKRKLYYKEIAIMTHTHISESDPIFEKMIITKQDIDILEHEDILRGILTFNMEEILVSESEAKKIISAYPELKNIFDKLVPYYKISQYDIINSNKLDWDYNKRASVLLKIMSVSNNSTQSVIIQEPHMHNLFFTLQGLENHDQQIKNLNE